MQKKYIIISIALIAWIGVIFVDAKQKDKTTPQPVIETNTTLAETTETGNANIFETSKEKKSKAAADLEALKKIYEKNKTDTILKQIIEKEAQNYQFNDAIDSIKQLQNPQEIDPKLYLYIAINSSALKVGEPQSIDNILQIVNTYKSQWEIDSDDVAFYLWLKEIRNLNYTQALIDRESIQKNEYKSTISAFKTAINSDKNEKSLPTEYRDGLVALTALKNWYFTIARKISIECINKNEKYILPYQILAYSHFLSNNWDTAIEYFLKLSEFDHTNKDMYNFLIWVAYYRKGDYSSSALYLSQVKKTNPSDTLRYLIQDYLQMNTNDKAKQARSILIKQKDVSPSDFSLYFYSILYKSYFTMNPQQIEEYQNLSTTYLETCDQLFPENDVCMYWKFAKSALENTIQTNEAWYIGLVSRYNVSYLYHILGDYFIKNKQKQKAEQAFAKAFTLTEDGNEKSIIKEKLNQITP